MRRYFFIAFLLVIFFSIYWVWNHRPEIKQNIQNYIENKEVTTIERKYSFDEILDTFAQQYTKAHTPLTENARLKFYPYLLMEVKYLTGAKKLYEGVLLWSMIDGEMVLDSNSWEMSNGFEACILKQASRADFKVLNALARLGGKATRERLMTDMGVGKGDLDPWIQSAYKKSLVIQEGKTIALQFYKPKFYVPPLTRVNEWLNTKSYSNALRVASKYNEEQIVSIAEAAFGRDFSITGRQVVYLPVYSIDVLGRDGTLHSTLWNAFNGKEMQVKHLAKVD